MSLALVVAAGVAYARSRHSCGAQVTSVSANGSTSPFLDAEQRAAQPDRDRDTLVKTLEVDPAPIGEVVGAVGYHYEQWAHVSAYAQGIGVRTRDNPDFTMLDDESVEPSWSVKVTSKRSAYDASAKRYLVATMPGDAPSDLVVLDAGNGKQVWCSPWSEGTVRADDPWATQFLDGEDVAVLGPAGGKKERIVRFSERDGSMVWEHTLDADSGDFLGDMGEDTLLAGGREQFRLFDPQSMGNRPAGTSLVLLSARDGSTLWTHREPAGSDLHVVGTDPETGTAIVQEWSVRAGSAQLRAINRKGDQEWFAVPARGDYFDAALRGSRILVRSENQWSAYALEDGHLLWRRSVPAKPQFLPYGFELDSIPMLDADHVLIGGTSALHTLDLRSGSMTSAPLPTDGINTTYWPYEVAVSDRLIAVATNTGAVVVRRE